MSGSNLLRMDDFLLKGALLLGAVMSLILLGVSSAVMAGDFVISGRVGFGLMVFAAAPVVMGLVGYRVRRRENHALALWKLIDRDVEISTQHLFRDSDWTPAVLDRALRDLNNAGVAYVVWDRPSGLIQNGRLRRSTLVVDECNACSNKISLQVTIGSRNAVLCPYCHEPIDIARVAEEKARLIDELEVDRNAPSPAHSVPQSMAQEESSFSIVIFAVLFMVFWPAGVWYCLRHRTHLRDLIA